MNTPSHAPNWHVVVKRIAKYIAEAVVVALATYYLPTKRLSLTDIAIVSLVAATMFSVLDTVAPSLDHQCMR
jgi:hypothetical protein